MIEISRRNLFISAAGAAALFGLSRHVTFIDGTLAQAAPERGRGFKHFRVGDIQMTTLYDGVVARKQPDPTFIRNASVDDLAKALAASGLPTNDVPNIFTVPIARAGGRTILFDAGTGGQLGPTTGLMTDNMKAAGIDPGSINTILISHFHPDHIFGLMAPETNAAVYPNAEIVMPEVEYNWWTDSGVFTTLPEARHGLARRIQAVFPGWKASGKIRLIGDNVEVAPGIRSIFAPGHTPGHTAWHVASGNEQLIVLADVVTYNPVFLRNPGWHAAYDTDGPLAETTRRKLLDRVIADKARMTAYHFVFPAAGTIARDGSGYTFSPLS
jgi:glyoxylase-like metal-dependent hydrolase (beta-lactamase superfamily II)